MNRSVFDSLGSARSASNATARSMIALSSPPVVVFARLYQASAVNTRCAVAVVGRRSSSMSR